MQHMSKDTHFLNRTIIFSFCSFELTNATFVRDQSSLRRIHRVEFCGELVSYDCLDNNYNRFKRIKLDNVNVIILIVVSGDPLGEQFRPPFCDTVIRGHKWFWLPRTRNRVKNVSTLIREYLTSVGRGCHMILNLNPDPFGLIEDEDLHAYKGFGEAIGLLYKDLIITQKNATLKIGVEKVWRIPRILNVANGSVVVMEDVAKFGQLVSEYQLRFNTSHGWVNYPEYGSTIGHKRIHPFPQVLRGKTVYAISFKIVKLVTRDPSITIREVSVYDWTEATRKRYI